MSPLRGAQQNGFRFVRVESHAIETKPSMKAGETGGKNRYFSGVTIRRESNEQLSVISILLQRDIVGLSNVKSGRSINSKQERTQDRSLRHTRCAWHG
jgi:hypothetical protein